MKTWKSMLRRGFALFLVLAMCLSMLQLTALAADGETRRTSSHTHHAEGWICTPYCSLPEHTHTSACYHMTENEEQARIPVHLPDDIEVNDGTSTEFDDFGNPYEPPEYIVFPAGEGEDQVDTDQSVEGEGGFGGFDDDNGFFVGDEDTSTGGDDDASAGGDDDASAGGDDDVSAGGDDDASAGGDDDASAGGDDDVSAGDDDDASAGGDGDASADGDDGDSAGGEPVVMTDDHQVEVANEPVPQSGEPELELQCGMEEHKHTDACAGKPDGGWHCVPDTNITINVPEERIAEGSVDLLSGVTATPAYCGNWKVQIAVASVIAEDGSEIEPNDGQWLDVEDGVVYTVNYVAYLDAVMTLSEDSEAQDMPVGILAQGTGTVEGEAVEGAARIGDKVYQTLQEAVDAAAEFTDEAPAILLLTDVHENILSKGLSFTLDMQGHTVHSAEVGKNVISVVGGTVIIQNGTITGGDYGNRNNQDGKGVFVSGADVTLVNCEIKDNKGHGSTRCYSDDGIWPEGTWPSNTFPSKLMGGDGGGVFAVDGKLTLDGCTVSNNTSSRQGAGVFAMDSDVVITGGTKLLDNAANQQGGGIAFTGSSGSTKRLTMDGVTVSGNSASNRSGCGIYVFRAGVDIENTVVSSNNYSSGSIPVYVENTGTANTQPVNFKNVEIVNDKTGNTAYMYAAYMNMSGSLTMEDCSIHDSLGGLYLLGTGEKSLTNCQFLNNDCTYNNGVYAPVYIGAGNAVLEKCTFTGNTGAQAGAINNASTGTITLDGCLISGNTVSKTSSTAGAIYTSKGTMIVKDTIIKENTVTTTYTSGVAGGVYVSSSASFTMESGALYKNEINGTSLANDVYSSSNTTLLKACDMVDGEFDFTGYVWSNLSSIDLTDGLSARTGTWTATRTGDVAAIGDTIYQTLDAAMKAVKDGETIRLLVPYVPASASYTIANNITLDVGTSKVYPTTSTVRSRGLFQVTAGTLNLTGEGGSIGAKIMMNNAAGTLNINGNVSLKANGTSSSDAMIQNKNGAAVNINGKAESPISVYITNGTLKVSEEAHAGELTAFLSAASGNAQMTADGEVDTLTVISTGSKSVTMLNGPVGALVLKAYQSSNTIPSFTAGKNFSAESFLFYPCYLNTGTSYDENGIASNGILAKNALADPEQQVADHILIHGGADGMNFANANWFANISSNSTDLSKDILKWTDGKDYKFLTAVVGDEDGNIVLRKTAVTKDSNYILVDSAKGNDLNDGATLNTPVKTFGRAKQILDEKSDATTIHVLGTIKVTNEETWSLGEGQKLESFPTFNGELVNVPSGAVLNLENITIDGKGISRTYPLIENNGTLNIGDGTVLTGGVNTTTYLGDRSGNNPDGGAVYNSGTLHMNGGIIENNTARNGGGVFNRGTFNLSGGDIRKNSSYGGSVSYFSSGSIKSDSTGGGVFLGFSGVMHMSGGTISENSAGVGGGISMGNMTNVFTAYSAPSFYMTGGTIADNTSRNVGGGLFVQEKCYAKITGSDANCYITGNYSGGGAFGGGGIYVNGGVTKSSVNGKLELENAAIMNNTAASTGGGIAGCPTSNLNIYLSDGGVIANNKAQGKAYDIWIQRMVSDPYHTGTRGTAFISKYMLGGGLYNWMDFNTNTRMPSQSFTSVNVFLYGTPKAEDVQKAESMCTVFITGNTAATAGGGIGTNGDVTIGTDTGSNTFDVTFNKSWLNADGSEMTEEELEELDDLLGTLGFVLWRRATEAGGAAEESPNTRAMLRAAAYAEDAEKPDFGDPPPGDGWEMVDWLFRGWNGSTLNTADFWGSMTFRDLAAEGYEYALSEVHSSIFKPQQQYTYFTAETVLGSGSDTAGGIGVVNQIEPAKLILKKVVLDEGQSLGEKTFNFKVILVTPKGETDEQDVKLTAGEEVVIETLSTGKKIPVGTKYTIVEDVDMRADRPDLPQWYVASTGTGDSEIVNEVFGGASIENTMGPGNNTVTYTNSTEPYGSLTVTKTVQGGTSADKDLEWKFEIRLSNENGTALTAKQCNEIDFGKDASGNAVTPSENVNNDYTPVVITLKHGESYRIDRLPVGVNYEVQEIEGESFPKNCTVTYTDASGKVEKHGDSFTAAFTNKLPTPTSVEVQKIWNDSNNPNRPTSITVRLLRDGTAYGSDVTLNAGNNWRYTWNDLEQTHGDPEVAYVWSVEEVGVPEGYTSRITNVGNQWTITNSLPDNPPPPSGDDDDDDDDDDVPPPPPEMPIDPNPTPLTELPDPNDPESPEEVTILEDDVPKTYIKTWDPEEEEYVYIPEDEVPLGNMVPQTGDSFSAGLWTTLCLTSAAGLGALRLTKPRKKEEVE